MEHIEKYIFIFLIGGFGYGGIEVFFRGFTHWSMIITGGTALVLLTLIYNGTPSLPISIKAVLGTFAITMLELSVGIIINKIFSFGVWDYTDLPANFLGQISLRFSLCWYAISFFCFSFIKAFQKLTNRSKLVNLNTV